MNRNELLSEIAGQQKKLNWLKQNPELQPIHLTELLQGLKELNRRLEFPGESGKSVKE